MMRWKLISEITNEEKYNYVLHVHHPSFIDEDFNPEGIIEAVCTESGDGEPDSWIGAFWDNDQDCWDTRDLEVVPTHFIIMKKPNNI